MAAVSAVTSVPKSEVVKVVEVIDKPIVQDNGNDNICGIFFGEKFYPLYDMNVVRIPYENPNVDRVVKTKDGWFRLLNKKWYPLRPKELESFKNMFELKGVEPEKFWQSVSEIVFTATVN
jgi:hypothetical protein